MNIHTTDNAEQNPAAFGAGTLKAGGDTLANSNSHSAQQKDAAMVNALAIVAHDLRGPLASLSVLIELIETYSQLQALNHTMQCTRRAMGIIDNLDGMLTSLLDHVKATGDPLGYRPSLVSVNEVVEKAMALNQPVASKQSALARGSLTMLHVSTDPGAPVFRPDGSQGEQIMSYYLHA